MKKYFLPLCFLFTAGCELVVDVDIPFEASTITLNSLFNPDSVFTAKLYTNRHILNDSSPYMPISDATLVVYDESGEPVDTLVEKQGEFRYVSDEKPVPGKRYTLRATAPKYKAVEATSSTPPIIPLQGVEVIERESEGITEKIYKIKFADDPTITNYYEFFITREGETINYATNEISTFHARMGLTSNNPALNNGKIESGINEEEYKNQFVFNDFLLTTDNEFEFKSRAFSTHAQRIVVTLRSLSEDLYKYKTTAELQQKTSGDPFAQPVNVYNNIKNGYGIFAGYQESTFVIESPVPEITGIYPSEGKPGDQITITGENFDPEYVLVRFTTASGYSSANYLTNVTENTIETTIPQDAVSGKVYVYTYGKLLTSPFDFIVNN